MSGGEPAAQTGFMAGAAFRRGLGDALGVPGIMLIASHIGFGATARALDFTLPFALFTTIAVWATPGQIILLESAAVGATALVIVPAVMLAAARFLPMSMVLTPVLRDPRYRPWHYYCAAHLIAMTTWTVTMSHLPGLPTRERLPYFWGFALVCWGVSIVAVMLGYVVSGALPHWLRLGLVFIVPVYFTLLLTGEVRLARARLAIASGAIAGPLLHQFVPQWSVLLAGLIGGTVAWMATRRAGVSDA